MIECFIYMVHHESAGKFNSVAGLASLQGGKEQVRGDLTLVEDPKPHPTAPVLIHPDEKEKKQSHSHSHFEVISNIFMMFSIKKVNKKKCVVRGSNSRLRHGKPAFYH